MMDYAKKKLLGLVPQHYDVNSRGFASGAFKNWSAAEAIRKAQFAFDANQLLSRERGHRFTEHYKPVRFDK